MEDKQSDSATQAVTASSLSAVQESVNTYDNVLREYGITSASQLHVPVPPTTVKSNLDGLCILSTPIRNEYGEQIKCDAHTGPLVFLEKKGEQDGDRFEESGYDGFYIYYILHPKKGKTVVTIGRPANRERIPSVVKWLDTLKVGDVFQVASFKTSAGYRTFQMVPPQQ